MRKKPKKEIVLPMNNFTNLAIPVPRIPVLPCYGRMLDTCSKPRLKLLSSKPIYFIFEHPSTSIDNVPLSLFTYNPIHVSVFRLTTSLGMLPESELLPSIIVFKLVNTRRNSSHKIIVWQISQNHDEITTNMGPWHLSANFMKIQGAIKSL